MINFNYHITLNNDYPIDELRNDIAGSLLATTSAILLNNSQVPPGLIIPARAVMKGIPVEPIREQSRNDMLKVKDRAEHYSQLFVKIKEQLPNAQSYVLTFSDFLKILLNKEG